MRVRVEIRLAPAAVGDVRIALSRPEIGVPEHLLHGSEVGAALEEVRCEGVAQEVRMHPARLEPCAVGQLLQDEKRARSGERASAGVQEELRPVPAVEVGPAERKVAADGLRRGPPEWDEALLRPFSEDANDALLERDAALFEPGRLRDAQTGSVQELHERAVPKGPRCRSGRGVD